jgi:hypothetical protein
MKKATRQMTRCWLASDAPDDALLDRQQREQAHTPRQQKIQGDDAHHTPTQRIADPFQILGLEGDPP